MRLSAWTRPVPAAPLGMARIATGLAALAKLLIVGPDLLALSLPGTVRLPWIDGFAPAVAMPYVVIAAWTASAVAFTAGFRTRAAGIVLCITAALTLASDHQLYSNHLYLLILLAGLLVLSDAGADRSIDAGWRSGRTVSGLGPQLLRIQVTIVYGYAALWKINLQFLSGAVLGIYLREGFVALPVFADDPVMLAWLAIMTVLMEFFVAFGLWSARLRPLAAAVGIALHIAFVLFISIWGDLVVFGLLMVGTYPLFFALRVNESVS